MTKRETLERDLAKLKEMAQLLSATAPKLDTAVPVEALLEEAITGVRRVLTDKEVDRRQTLHDALDNLEQLTQELRNTAVHIDALVEMETMLQDAIADLRRVMRIKVYPDPTVEPPDFETLMEWMWEDGGCEATDGCWIEPDGICSHGHPSWLLRFGLI